MKNKYYVYFIYLEDTLVYIGKGIAGRFYRTTSQNKHLACIPNSLIHRKKKYFNLKESQALEIERVLIHKYQPIFNNRMNTKYSHAIAKQFTYSYLKRNSNG